MRRAGVASRKRNYPLSSEEGSKVLSVLNYAEVTAFKEQAPACAGGVQVCSKLLSTDVTSGIATLVCGVVATTSHISPPSIDIRTYEKCPRLLKAAEALKSMRSN